MNWLRRFKAEWTKNDGKPWNEWAPGPDLKDVTLRGIVVLLCLMQIGLVVAWMIQ